MHLEGERGTGLHKHRRSRQEFQWILTGSIAHQNIARIGWVVRLIRRLSYECDNVMDYGALTGPDFGRFHPPVFREVRGNREQFVGDNAVRWDLEIRSDVEDGVGFANAPARFETRQLRQLFWIALWRTCIGPRHLPTWFGEEDRLGAELTHSITMDRFSSAEKARLYQERVERGEAFGLRPIDLPRAGKRG